MAESALSRFAAEMKAWRAKLGITQPGLATMIGYSAALVAAIEQCQRSPQPTFAEACDAATGAPGTFARWQGQVVQESYPAFFAPVIEFEREAIRIHDWELGVLPGLVQTEAYAEAVILARHPGKNAKAVAHILTARMDRQEMLDNEQPMLWYAVQEGVLRQMVGGPAVMAAQLDHLLKLIAARRVVLQVLPFTASEHPGAEGPITIFEFANSPTVGYTECHGGGRIVDDGAEVADLMTIMSAVRSSALSPVDSAELIREIRSEIDEQ
jgi:transcriptional regulator with XRE-family HTH domain